MMIKQTSAPEQTIDLVLVDDDPNTLKAISRIFYMDRIQISCFDSPLKALEFADRKIKVIVSDNRMPCMSGIELLNEFRQKNPRATRILITGHADMESMEAAINSSQIYKYISKPYNSEAIREIVFEAIAKYDEETRQIDKSANELSSFENAQRQIELYEKAAKEVAHDLRNPLSTLRLGLELVEDGISSKHDNSTKNFLEASLRSIDRLTVITNQLTLSEKIDQKQERIFTDLKQVVNDVVSIERIAAKRKRLSIEVESPDVECWARIEEDKASRLLFNIIGNSIKYTHEGGVRINIRKNESRIDVEIMDTGDGIPQDKLHWIFEQDTRLEDHANIQGSGVGLSVCKEIVTNAGGELSVNSVVGVGSVFLISIPRANQSGTEVQDSVERN